MSDYFATIVWKRGDDASFADWKYSRQHELKFDGLTVPGSASPSSVPEPYSIAAAVDPEEAFVASISSCHMLWFLWIAAKRGFVVDSYTDAAVGTLERNPEGKMAMTRVLLRPDVRFSGETLPDSEDLSTMHHEAHAECYIANSVTSDITCEPVVA